MTRLDPALWRDMLNYLRREHAEICRQWFEELEPLDLDGGVLQIRVHNTVQKNYLTRQCTAHFNDAAQVATGALVAVAFVNGTVTSLPKQPKLQESAPAVPEVPTGTIPPRPTTLRPVNGNHHASPVYVGELLLSPDYTFDNFVIGPGNRLACAASVAVAQQPAKAYNPLFIHGGVGLGKTHLLQAICQTILHDNPQADICYLSCDSFINDFMDAVQNGQMHDFRNRYRHVDLLIIDDIHFLANRDRTQEEFFHTFNTLYQAGRQIVLSSDSPPNEIPQLEDRLISRFNWGLVARVDSPCYETRVAIVKKKAALRGLTLPEDVVAYIAGRIESNTRELEGAITKTQSLAMLNDEPITLALAQDALGDRSGTPKNQLSIQTIIDAVTDFYGVKLSDLQSKRRHRSITVPRQVCMYLARKRTGYSLEEIGGYFGGRDHTTVMHAIRTIDDRVQQDTQFAGEITQLDTQLRQPPKA
jgi:chromosomal replication initiator protein